MNAASTRSPTWPQGAWLDVGDGHRVWWCEGGDAGGWPVLIVHGGPGGASRIETTRWFDGLPVRWIVFDQRGCGRSTPLGATVANDLAALVGDAERLRARLGIERWALVGGSWGARVALAYAAAHTARVAGLFVRSPFLGSPAEAWRYVADWDSWLGETGRRWLGPALASDFRVLFQVGTAGDDGRGARLGDDEALARAWSAYDDAQSAPGGVAASGARFARERLLQASADLRASWRVHAHYAASAWGVPGSAWALDDVVPRGLQAVGPLSICWGSADATCDPQAAAALARQWPQAHAVEVAGAGHRMADPQLRPALIEEARSWIAALGPPPTSATSDRSCSG